MGYRSDVHGIIYSRHDGLAALVAAASHKGIWNRLDGYVEVKKIRCGGVTYDALLLHHEGVKWYDSFDHVKAWYELKHLIEVFDKPESPIHCEFARVGEEMDDNEYHMSDEALGLVWIRRYPEGDYDVIEAGEETNG